MATTLTTFTAAAGGKILASDINTLVTVANFLVNPPRFVGRATSAQSIANNTWTAILLDTEEIDSFGGHSTSVNTSRYTPTQPGWYLVSGRCALAANATGIREVTIEQNAGATARYHKTLIPSTASADASGITVGPLYFNGTTDYAEMFVIQTSGGALNTTVAEDGAPGSNPRLAFWWVGSSAT